jgi:glycosyltransferase involved in cell wall biosynthesis
MRYQLERFPKVSVVTPSFNQGPYLRETLASLVDQRYPNLELIVMDGGSTDESLEVIRSFEGHLAHWESERDRGQAHAINKGLERATGEVLCWLNSDDVLLPGALNAVAYAFSAHEDWDWISAPSLKFGERLHEISGRYELPRDRVEWLVHCPISQPSTFWRRSLYERHGGLDESFHYALDYEYWVRFVFGGAVLHFVDRPLSAYRLHEVSKTVAQAEKFKTEEARLREKRGAALTAQESARLARLLSRSEAVEGLVASVALLQDREWAQARAGVLAAIKKNPGLALTKTGAASLFRVLFRRPRYNE